MRARSALPPVRTRAARPLAAALVAPFATARTGPALVALTVLVNAAPLATAQTPIQWRSDLSAAVRDAQRTLKPLLFRVSGGRDDENDELDEGQQRAYRDRIVRAIVSERFVPVNVPRSTANLAMLRRLGLPTGHGLYLAVVSPRGAMVGVVDPLAAASPQPLALRLTQLFRTYRQRLFEEDYKPLLEKDALDVAELRRTLGLIRQFVIVEADAALVELLERDDLPARLRPDVFRVLAMLSTPAAVDALFERAQTNREAADALRGITPLAAERLLAELDEADGGERFMLAYEVVADVTNYPDRRPRGFWQRAAERVKSDELERIRTHVRRRADRWWLTYEQLR